MTFIDKIIADFASFIWGLPLLILLIGGGLYLLILSKFLPFRFILHAINVLRGKYDNANDKGVFDADDISWSASTITARGAVLYKARGGASSADEIIAYLDFVTDKQSNGGNFNLVFNVNGILTLA